MFGWESEKAIDQAREQIARLINADQKEVIFTSGATESNNLAIKGMAGFYGNGDKDHFITSQIEHKCVLDSFRAMESKGFKVTYLPVGLDGMIDPHMVDEAINDRTIGVSIHMVNNEISVV
jgi:cysteine desulfurase